MKENLLIKYPKINIVNTISPPFGSAQELANVDIIDRYGDYKNSIS